MISTVIRNQRKAARREKLRTQIIPSNPLKADPTRTATLRRIFQTDFRKRFNFLKGLILQLIVEEDAFGLLETSLNPLTGDFRRAKFRTRDPRPTPNDQRIDTSNQESNRGNGESKESSSSESKEDGRTTETEAQNSRSASDARRIIQIGNEQTLNTRWKFNTNPEKLQLFQIWLAAKTQDGILGGVTAQTIDDAYWRKYVEEGYKKGAGRAFNDVRKPALASGKEGMAFFEGTKDEFLRQSFAHPIAVEKVKLLTGRVLTELKGVNDAMAQRMMRELADGLVQGKGPREVARDLNKAIDIGKNRALTIARTETVRAHAEGQLDALEGLGVTEVGVQVEWSTAGDDRVCPLCLPLEGVVMKIKEARGTLPRHPSCRCAYIPAGVGESSVGQKKSSAKIKRAFEKSVKAEAPELIRKGKRTLAEQKKHTTWIGADKTIAKARPKSVLDKPKPTNRKRKKKV